MKRVLYWAVLAVLLLNAVGCGGVKPGALTMDAVRMLAEKGDALLWEDFADYTGNEIGSGLYIMQYDIDDTYAVLVGGIPNEKPWYIYLCNRPTEERVDIRYDSIDGFLAG